MTTPAAAPPIGVGLLGLGVVGSGVLRALQERAAFYAQRAGRDIEVRRIAVRDPARPRAITVAPGRLTTDPLEAATAVDVDVVVEVMGGEEPAATAIRGAIQAGKHVVTANKELMAKRGPELLMLAQEHGVELLYEASVGGGIPIIASLKRDLQANEIRQIQAIINGTTNFILTAIAREGVSYETALAEAQRRGYAESDPTADVDGTDAAYKLAILATIAFHVPVHPDAVYREGITHLVPRDFTYARQLGYVIRLIATARLVAGQLEARVHPTMVPDRDPLATVDGVLNAVSVEGDLLGRALFEGPGAGTGPTTSAVLADLLGVVAGIGSGRAPRPLLTSVSHIGLRPMGDLRMRYYLRALVLDRPGVLAEIGQVLAENHISIATLLQMESDAVAGTAELVITTHDAQEVDMERFLAQAVQTPSVREIGIRIRMESTDA